MSEWREAKLDELCEFIVDSEHKTAPKSVDGAHPLVRTTDLGSARVDYASAQRVDEPTYKQWTRRAAPAEGDLILAREAPVGGVGRVPAGVAPVLGQRTVLLRPDPSKADSRFLLYRLASPDLQARMNEMATGATVPHLNMSDIRSFAVPVPTTTREQLRIGKFLRTFDEIIEINERRIKVLEDLVRSLYREWYVRLRFPGHEVADLVDSELGPLPRAWSAQRLDEVATLTRTNVMPARFPETVFDHYSIPAFDETRLPASEPGATIKSGKFRVVEASVLISKLNPRISRAWFVQPIPGHESIASTEFLVWTTEVVTNAFLWACFESEPFRAVLAGLAGGTSTSHQRAKPGDVAAIPIAVPDAASLRSFDQFAAPALEFAAQLRWGNRTLGEARDLLLPRVVTGSLDVDAVDLGALLPSAVT